MKLRNRIIDTNIETDKMATNLERNTEINNNEVLLLQPNNSFLNLSETIQENIVNSFKELQLESMREKKEVNKKIFETLERITKQTNSFEETRKKTESQRNKNTIILILFSIILSGTISYISLELGEIIITNIILLPVKVIETVGKYTLSYVFTYNTNYLTNTITSFSLPEDLKELEYITKFYITTILSFIVYTILNIMRLMTNISTGKLSITITPLSFKSEETKTNNIVSNTKNIKSICDTIKEIYSNKKNNIDIQKTICYDNK